MVDVLMTGRTRLGQSSEVGLDSIGLLVAGAARNLTVTSQERIVRFVVIEMHLLPACIRMAKLTPAGRNEFLQLRLVWIGVTHEAARRFEIESDPGCLGVGAISFVAGVAGHCDVRPPERVSGLIVLSQSKTGGRESQDRVTLLAGAS